MAHCSACVLQCPPGPHQTPAVWHTGWPPSQCGPHPYHSHAHTASPEGGREGGREWREGGREGGKEGVRQTDRLKAWSIDCRQSTHSTDSTVHRLHRVAPPTLAGAPSWGGWRELRCLVWVLSCSTAPARNVSQPAINTLRPFSISQKHTCGWRHATPRPEQYCNMYYA